MKGGDRPRRDADQLERWRSILEGSGSGLEWPVPVIALTGDAGALERLRDLV